MATLKDNALRISQMGIFSLIPTVIFLAALDVNPINQYRLLKYGRSTTATVTEMELQKLNANDSAIPTTYYYTFHTADHTKYSNDKLVWGTVPDVSENAEAPFKAKLTYLPSNPHISSFSYRVPKSLLDLIFPPAAFFIIPFISLCFFWPKKGDEQDVVALSFPVNKELALLISLITYGNEFFRSGKLPKRYFPDNLVFRGLKNLRFIGLGVGEIDFAPKWVIAKDPQSWFELLKKDGCERLSLSFDTDDPQDYNVWFIEAVYPFFTDIYEMKDGKQLEMQRIHSRVVKPRINYNLNEAHEDFKSAIVENAFYTANVPVLQKYGETFNIAYNFLIGNLDTPDNPSIIPSTQKYSTTALQIIHSALIINIYSDENIYEMGIFTEFSEANEFYQVNNLLLESTEKALAAAVNSIYI